MLPVWHKLVHDTSRGCIMNNESIPTNEPFQYVAVPQQYVSAVYRLLAELADAATSTTTADSADTSPDFGIEGWTAAKLTRFAAGDTKTTQLVAEIMNVLAKIP